MCSLSIPAPFMVRSINTDSGSEFINYLFLALRQKSRGMTD
ncbi:MAG: hypothetical protein Q4A24_06250 [Akkermansia sp.]|nr:hypothetical protein [Akkermansia sp.]